MARESISYGQGLQQHLQRTVHKYGVKYEQTDTHNMELCFRAHAEQETEHEQ